MIRNAFLPSTERCLAQCVQTVDLGVLQPAVQSFSRQFPKTVEQLTRLEQAGMHTAVSFSLLTKFVAATIGMSILREPDDTDLLALNEEFEDIAGLLGVELSPRELKILLTRDGLDLRFDADGIQAWADTPMQLVRPLTPMIDKGYCYQTAFTKAAVAARKVFETNEGLVPVAHPADAMLLYAVGQRHTATKDDAFNTNILRKFCTPDDSYLQARGREIGAEERVWSFISGVGQTTTRQVLLAA